MTFLPRAAAIALVAGVAAPLTAQTAPQTVPTLDNYSLPTSRPTAVPIPPAPLIVLPTPTPTPLPSPSPTATSTSRGVTRPAEAPRKGAAPPVPTPTPTPTPTPEPTATPTPVETPPAILLTPAPVASTPVAAMPVAATPAGKGGNLLWWIGPAVLALVIGLVLRRRRRDAAPPQQVVATAAERPAAAPPVSRPAPRALIGVSLRPIRAGLNMLSATVEAELTVVNTGDAPATDIRIALALFSARAGQDGELADHQSQPILRSAVPPFDLAPGETRNARVVVALPRAQITPMTAANRPMFVPLVAANCLYATMGLAAQTAQSFAIGIERVDSPKLAPFWLDTPARMHDHVAARPQAPALLL